MYPIFNFCCVVLFLISYSAKADSIDCHDAESWSHLKLESKTAQDCEKDIKEFIKNCEQDGLESTDFSVHMRTARTQCLKSILTKELDKRLLKLKTSHPQEFKLEIEIQKNFNFAIQKA